MGISQINLVPTYALLFLTLGCVSMCCAIVVVFMRPFHRTTTVKPQGGGGTNGVLLEHLSVPVDGGTGIELGLATSRNPMQGGGGGGLVVGRECV